MYIYAYDSYMYVFTSRLHGILKPLSEGCHQFQSWLDRLNPATATMMHPIPRSSIDGMTLVLIIRLISKVQ